MELLGDKKYKIIYADPAWKYWSKSAVNNTKWMKIKPLSEHYDTMTTQDIKQLPVKDIIDDDCACFLWVTDSHLKEWIEVLESRGFKYKTIAFNWIKKTNKWNTFKNVAPRTLKSSEICLLWTKGRMTQYKKNNSVEQLVEAERTKHSKKPDEVRKRIEELFWEIPRLEMFARQQTEWRDVRWNEVARF